MAVMYGPMDELERSAIELPSEHELMPGERLKIECARLNALLKRFNESMPAGEEVLLEGCEIEGKDDEEQVQAIEEAHLGLLEGFA